MTSPNFGFGVPPLARAGASDAAVAESVLAVRDLNTDAQTFTPVWEASTTDPSIGNGTLEGRWVRVGPLVYFAVVLQAGSTTSFGSGSWLFGAPIPPNLDVVQPLVTGLTIRSASPGQYPCVGNIGTAGVQLGKIQFVSSNSTSLLSATVPYTWAQDDTFRISGVYEAVV